MPGYDPIHGIDYIIDYYLILGVGPQSSLDEIRKNFKQKIAKFHPDLVSRADESIKSLADRESKLLLTAYDVLTDKSKRKEYDKLLNKFRKDEPQLISKSGNPIFDPRRRSVLLGLLLSENGIEVQQDNYLEKIKLFSGYNKEAFELISEQYKEAEKPSVKLRTAYLNMLEAKNAFLASLEQIAWTKSGINNQVAIDRLNYPEDYSMKRLEQFKMAKLEIIAKIRELSGYISDGITPMFFLGWDRTPSAEPIKADSRAKFLIKTALKKFMNHRGDILDAAKDREEVLSELTKLTVWEYVPKEQEISSDLFMFLYSRGVYLDSLKFKYNIAEKKASAVDGHEYQHIDFSKLDRSDPDSEKNLSILSPILESSSSIIILDVNPEFDITLQINHAANEHFKKLLM